MFENIVRQEQVISRLRDEIGGKVLPSAILFYGEPYSGKLSTALELARVISCEEGPGEWNCSCSSCKKHRLLAHPSLLLLGSRYFTEEIAASADVLRRTAKESTRFLYYRAVKKLLKRFDSLLWDDNDPVVKKAQNSVSALEETLEEVRPGRKELPSGRELEKTLSDIQGYAEKAAAALPRDNIPIDQIRKATFWVHTTGISKRKIVILENAERMMEGSRNALLKVLEEPPPGVVFILITTRKSGLIPTILSRVRPYHFKERTEEGSKEVMEKIFREDPQKFKNLSAYFDAWRGLDPNKLKRDSTLFLKGEDVEGGESIASVIDTYASRHAVKPFLKELTRTLYQAYRTGIEADTISWTIPSHEKALALIRQSMLGVDSYNQSPKLILERLSYDIRKLV